MRWGVWVFGAFVGLSLGLNGALVLWAGPYGLLLELMVHLLLPIILLCWMRTHLLSDCSCWHGHSSWTTCLLMGRDARS